MDIYENVNEEHKISYEFLPKKIFQEVRTMCEKNFFQWTSLHMLPFVIASDRPFAISFARTTCNLQMSTEMSPTSFDRHKIHTSSFISFVTNGIDLFVLNNNEIIVKHIVVMIQIPNDYCICDADGTRVIAEIHVMSHDSSA